MRGHIALLGIIALIALSGTAYGGAFSVGATDNVFLAGQLAPAGTGLGDIGDGTLPVALSVVGGSTIGFSGIAVTSVPAFVSCNGVQLMNPAYQVTSPDGGTCGSVGSTDIYSYGGISGIKAPSTMFLTGVFLSGTIPGVAPASLDFTGGTGFATLSPLLGQTFFIGDGLTGTGSGMQQQFVVPAGATWLYLGFADGNDGTPFTGNNSHYTDNYGVISGNMDLLNSPVPEPGTLALLGLGMVGLGLLRRRS